MSSSELTLGRTIQLADDRLGTIRFIGRTRFAPGLWVGVELEDATGKNDGSVNDVRYFDTTMGHGMFVRPNALKLLVGPPAPFMPVPPAEKKKSTARPTSIGSNASSRAATPADSGLAKRMSLNARSPTPGQRQSRPASGVPSPTKQITNPPSRGTSSQSTSPPNGRPGFGLNAPRASLPGSRPSSIAPPAGRQTRQAPLSAPGLKPPTTATPKTTTGPARTLAGRLAPPTKTTISRPSGLKLPPSSRPTVAKPRPTANRKPSGGSPPSSAKSTDEESDQAAAFSVPVQSRALAIENRSDPANNKTSIDDAGEPAPNASTSAALKENEELKAKLRVLEKRRSDDRERLNTLERVQGERDRFERIIQTLQVKYQPQQQEITDLKRQLTEAETRLRNVEDIQQEHDSAMELATLDREMAEEMAEVYKTELDALKKKNEVLEREVEIYREEEDDTSSEFPADVPPSKELLQFRRDRERFHEALMRLNEFSEKQEEELEHSRKALKAEIADNQALREKNVAHAADLARHQVIIDDLREQLDNAHGSDDIIEALTEQQIAHLEEIEELKAMVSSLEELKDVSDELEINHVHNQRELQAEIDKRDAVISEQARHAALQQKSIEDMEYTLSRFRDLVASLQTDLDDMRASHAVTEHESEQLNTRSRAMLDLNQKLQLSAAKAQVKTIDLELRRMEAEEAAQHLEVVTQFLPAAYDRTESSVHALLRFKRLASKAAIINNSLKERINLPPLPGHENDLFESCDAIDKLTWVSSMCDRFVESISHCSTSQFDRYRGAHPELEPVERALNGWIENLRHDDFQPKQCSEELQRTITLMTHLGEVHISNDLPSFADDIFMKTLLMQSYLESAATTITATTAMVQHVVQDEDELSHQFAKRTQTIITQTRSAKVIAGRAVLHLADLKVAGLSLSPEALGAFERCETTTADLASMARNIGSDLHKFLHDEARTEPYTLSDVQACAKTTIETGFGSDESGLFATYMDKLLAVTSQLSDLVSLSSKVHLAQECERGDAPWKLLSQEIKSLQKIPVEVEAECKRLKDDLANARRTAAIQEETLSTANLKIETLESRMRDAKEQMARIADLEALCDAASEMRDTFVENLDKQDRELKALEEDRDKWRQIASSSRAIAGGSEEADQARLDRQQSDAHQIDKMGEQINNLQAGIRWLQEDNLRARTTEQPNHDWLAEPLTKTPTAVEQRKSLAANEGRAVLGQLLNLAGNAKVFDMSTLPADKTGWKPAKSTPQYHAADQAETFGAWKEWRAAAIRNGGALGAEGSRGGRSMYSGRLEIVLPVIDKEDQGQEGA
ncbi:dynein associated protein-domain-containing protein, partial [Chaetomium sp. MPI-SDFR-AT-0129]